MKTMIKQLGNSFYKPHTTPLLILSAISFGIWFAGPFISIADFTPLFSADKRFYLILALFLAWFLKIMFLDGRLKKETPRVVSLKHPEYTKRMAQLTGRFKGATDFLKKTIINKNGKDTSLHHLPWYLIIGPSGAGKTSLLANSGINYILSKQVKGENAQKTLPSEFCDWWVTRDSVLVDVPGAYMQSPAKLAVNATTATKQKTAIHYMLWKSFLELISKYRGKRSIQGIIITLPLPELISHQASAKENLLQDVKYRIAELKQQFGDQLTFHIVVTKCDLLSGFSEFFSDSGSDEISQAWGVTLPSLKEGEQTMDVFEQRFNALVKRINKQLIWRLHQERNPFTRPYIKDFPLQVERLKENLMQVCKMLSQTGQLRLQGVYLSSALQIAPEDTSTLMSAPSAQTSLQIMRNPSMPSRAYFVKQLLLQGILSSGDPIPVSDERVKTATVIALSFGAVLFMGLLFGNDIRNTIKQTFAIRTSLADYQNEVNLHGVHFDKALPLLDALQLTSQQSSHSFFFYSDKAQQSAYAAYQQALRTIVLPELKTDFETYLQQNDGNPDRLYAALKGYLMLGDAQRMQSEYVINQLKYIAPNLFAGPNKNQMLSHMHIAYNATWQPMTLDPLVIAQARRHLFNLSPVQLSFVILKNMTPTQTYKHVNLGTNIGNTPALMNHNLENYVPTFYTADAFSSVYEQQTDSAATEASQGNWVLGNAASINELNNTPLVEQARDIYVQDYIHVWQKVLASITLPPHNTYAQIDTLIKNLAAAKSPLLDLLTTVKQNTSFKPITSANPQFAALNTLINDANTPNSGFAKIQNTLDQLHVYLQNLMNANNVSQAAYFAAKDRMKAGVLSSDPLTQLFALAKSSPEPLKTWLTDIAQSTWHAMLADSAQFVENRWRANIQPAELEKLAQQKAGTDPFAKLIGTKSTMNNFYQNYLQSFIEVSNKGWQWKILDNERLPVTEIVLSQLQQAAPLQTASNKKLSAKSHNDKELLLNLNKNSDLKMSFISPSNKAKMTLAMLIDPTKRGGDS